MLYAVYALLERLGCRWVHPGEAQEIVPKLVAIDLPDGEHIEIPRIEHRGLALYGLYDKTAELGAVMIDWMAKNRLNLLLTSWERPDPTNTQTMFWHQVGDRLVPELKRRGILLDMSEHSTEYFFPRSLFHEHPECEPGSAHRVGSGAGPRAPEPLPGRAAGGVRTAVRRGP